MFMILHIYQVLKPLNQDDNIPSFSSANNDFQVVEIVIHPKYMDKDENMNYDFALWRLNYPIADNAYGIGYASAYKKENTS